jgi:hypothetical protein
MVKVGQNAEPVENGDLGNYGLEVSYNIDFAGGSLRFSMRGMRYLRDSEAP